MGSTNDPFIQLELLEATHRALHKFIARHSDELELEIGDPIYVQKEAEDLWCEGMLVRCDIKLDIFCPTKAKGSVKKHAFTAGSLKKKKSAYE